MLSTLHLIRQQCRTRLNSLMIYQEVIESSYCSHKILKLMYLRSYLPCDIRREIQEREQTLNIPDDKIRKPMLYHDCTQLCEHERTRCACPPGIPYNELHCRIRSHTREVRCRAYLWLCEMRKMCDGAGDPEGLWAHFSKVIVFLDKVFWAIELKLVKSWMEAKSGRKRSLSEVAEDEQIEVNRRPRRIIYRAIPLSQFDNCRT